MEEKESGEKKFIRKKTNLDFDDPELKESWEVINKVEITLKKIDGDYKEKKFKRFDKIGTILKDIDFYSGLKDVDLKKNVGELENHLLELGNCIQEVVNVNYKGFNSTISNFSDIFTNFDSSRIKLGTLITSIDQCENLLNLRTEYLKSLVKKYKQNKEYLAILHEVKLMKNLPKEIENGIKTKHYLHTVNLINEYSSKMGKNQFKGISALNGVRRFVKSSLDRFPEILFEELNDFIYNNDPIILPVAEKKKEEPKKTSLIKRRNIRGRKRGVKVCVKPTFETNEKQRTFSQSHLIGISIIKDDIKKKVDTRSLVFPKMIVETLFILHQLQQAQYRLFQSLHLRLTNIIREKIKSYVENLQKNHLEVFSNLIDVKNDPKIGAYEKTAVQRELLTTLFSDVLAGLIKYEKNFRFLLTLIEEKNCQLKEKKEFHKKMKENKDLRYKPEKIDKPRMASALNQKLTKEILLQLREAIRTTIEQVKSSEEKRDDSYDQCYVDSMEDILNNFIEKEFLENNDISNMTVKIIIDVFVDKLRAELHMEVRDFQKILKSYKKKFKKVILESLVANKNPEYLKSINIFKIIQKVLKEQFLVDILQFNPNIKIAKKKIYNKVNIKFNFASNVLQENPGNRKSGKKLVTTENKLEKSFNLHPYNFLWVCEPLDRFIAESYKIIGVAETLKKPELDDLNAFANNGIDKLIKKLNAEYSWKIIEDLKEYDEQNRERIIFKPVQQYSDESGQRGKKRVFILDEQTARLKQYVEHLMSFINAISIDEEIKCPTNKQVAQIRKKFVGEIFEIISILFKNFYSKSRKRFHRIIQKKDHLQKYIIDKPSVSLPVLNKDPSWIRLYKKSNLEKIGDYDHIKYLQQTLNANTVLLDEKNTVILRRKFDLDIHKLFDSRLLGSELNKSMLIYKSSDYIFLAHLHNTIEWISAFITKLSFQDGESKTKNITIPGVIRSYSDRFLIISNFCLFTIKLDIRTHCFYFLKKMYTSSYEIRNEKPVEPEFFIQNLNTYINRIEKNLRIYFNPKKIKYLFHGISKLYKNFFLNCLSKLKNKNVTKYGVLQIKKNIRALQQNLNNILLMDELYKSREKDFTQLYEYFRLVTYSPGKLYSFLKTKLNKLSYTVEQINSITELDHYKNSEYRNKINSLMLNIFE